MKFVDRWLRDIARSTNSVGNRGYIETDLEEEDVYTGYEFHKVFKRMAKIEAAHRREMEEIRDRFAKLQELLQRAEERGSEPRHSGSEYSYENERADERRRERVRNERMWREEEKKQEERRRDGGRIKKEQRERERVQREQEERKKKAVEERRTRKQLEKEREEREQAERRQKEAEERRKRKTEERNERVHQRAARLREEKERVANEKAEAKKKRLEQAWIRYVTEWEELGKRDTNASSEKLHRVIPWPVISGNIEDVNDKNVEEFYRKASPYLQNAGQAFQLMKMECLKWHADRIPKNFGTTVDTSLTDLFNIVARIAIKLRSEAQEKRAR